MSEDHSDGPAADDTDEEEPLSELRERIEAERGANIDGQGETETEEEPLSELARESQSSTEREREELFEEVDVGEIDAEAVWDAVVEEGMPPETALGELSESEPAEPAEPTGPAEGTNEHVINKREYCQRCEYFSEPPDATCNHEGTEILELTDNDSFRVRDCPKVAASEEELSSVIEE